MTKYRVTPDDLEKAIMTEEYLKMGKKMTICLLTLQNGHEIIGKSGVVDHTIYDFDLGCKYARQDAVEQLWPLLGYEMQVKMYNDGISQ